MREQWCQKINVRFAKKKKAISRPMIYNHSIAFFIAIFVLFFFFCIFPHFFCIFFFGTLAIAYPPPQPTNTHTTRTPMTAAWDRLRITRRSTALGIAMPCGATSLPHRAADRRPHRHNGISGSLTLGKVSGVSAVWWALRPDVWVP